MLISACLAVMNVLNASSSSCYRGFLCFGKRGVAQVLEATEALGSQLNKAMVADMHKRAADVLQSIDYEAVATGEGEALPGHSAAGGAAGSSAAGGAAGRQPPPIGGRRGSGQRGGKAR